MLKIILDIVTTIVFTLNATASGWHTGVSDVCTELIATSKLKKANKITHR